MKTYVSRIVFPLLLVFLVCSCEKETILSVSQSSIEFSQDGGQQTIQIQTNKAWNCTSSQSWCKVSPASGAGDASVSITCDANPDYSERSCTITVTAAELTKTITVTQISQNGLIITQTEYALSNEAQQISVSIQANVSFSFTIEGSAQEWIKASSTKALSGSTVKFDIEANESFDAREGKIVFKQSDGSLTQTVTVKQSAYTGILLSSPEYSVSNEEHVITVEVESNVNYEAQSDCNWILIESTKAVTRSELTIKVMENTAYDRREGHVTLTQDSGDESVITIYQAESYGLFVSKDKFNLDFNAQTIEFEVKYNVDYEIIIPELAQPWISEIELKGLSSRNHTLSISRNEGSARSTTITIKQKDGSLCETVAVSQGAEVQYRLTDSSVISNINTYAAGVNDIKKLPSSQQSMVNMYLSVGFPMGKEKVRRYIIEYPSIGPDGKDIILSAAVMIPDKAFTSDRTINGIAIASHYTITSDAECPSRTFSAEGILAWTNNIVIMPDYYGFGSSADRFQAFLNKTIAGRNNIDAITAVQAFVKDNGLDVSDNMLNIGYSQGGYNALATLKYVTDHPELGIIFDKSFIGGGPYSVVTVFEDIIQSGQSPIIDLATLSIISYVENEHLGIQYSELFKEPLLSNVGEWYLSKKYSILELNELIGTQNPADVFTEALTSLSGPVYDIIADAGHRNSLLTGWAPSNGEKLYIYHSKDDEFVSYKNFLLLKEMFDSNPGNYTVEYTSGTGGHQECWLDFIMNTVVPNW